MIEVNRKTTSDPEYRKRQSEIMKEYYKTHKPTFLGRKHSEESKKKMSEIKKKQYKGRKWINDGEQEKFVNIDNGIPQGYLLGRLRKA